MVERVGACRCAYTYTTAATCTRARCGFARPGARPDAAARSERGFVQSHVARRRFGFQAPRRPRRDRARVLARYMTIEFVALPGTNL